MAEAKIIEKYHVFPVIYCFINVKFCVTDRFDFIDNFNAAFSVLFSECLSSPFLPSLILIYSLKFLACGELAFTHNGAHFIEPAEFYNQFQKCLERYLSFGFETFECRLRNARYFRETTPAQTFIKPAFTAVFRQNCCQMHRGLVENIKTISHNILCQNRSLPVYRLKYYAKNSNYFACWQYIKEANFLRVFRIFVCNRNVSALLIVIAAAIIIFAITAAAIM